MAEPEKRKKWIAWVILFVAVTAMVVITLWLKKEGKPPEKEISGEVKALSGHPPPEQVGRLAMSFPPGALVFIYAPDFAALQDKVRASDEFKTYLKSMSLERFTESRLFLKLEVRFHELCGLMSDEAGLGDLIPLAGTETAFALYDISELKFIYLSRVAEKELVKSLLWAARSRAQESPLEGASYYRLGADDGSRTLYYGLADDLLIVGNDEQTFTAGFSRALAGDRKPGSLADDERFTSAFPSGLKVHDLVMYLDQAALQEDSYFQRYWIYQNLEEISWIQSAALDLELTGGVWREKRYYSSVSMPAEIQNRELSPCWKVLSGSFVECMALSNARPAAELMASLFAQPEPESGYGETESKERAKNQVLAMTLTGLLEPAGPELAGSRLKINWDRKRRFADLDRSVVIILKDPGQLNLSTLRKALAEHWSGQLFAGAEGGLEFKEDEYGTSCLMPMLGGRGLWLDLSGPYLVASTQGELHAATLAQAKDSSALEAPLFSGLHQSHWELDGAQEDLQKIIWLLDREPGWPRSMSRAAMNYDLRAILNAVGPRRFSREMKIQDELVEETVVIEPGK